MRILIGKRVEHFLCFRFPGYHSMKTVGGKLLVLAVLASWSCIRAENGLADNGLTSGEQVPHLTDALTGGVAWYTHLNEPHAVHDGRKTYVAFHGAGEHNLDPLVLCYDHATGDVEGPVKVGENPLAEHNDSHGNPVVLVDNEGYIHVIFGGHGYYPGGRMTHCVSQRRGDISAWRRVDNIDATGTYPQLVKTSDGTIHYFYRAENREAGNHRGHWVLASSADHGLTFGESQPLLDGGRSREDRRYVDGLYYDAWYASIYCGEDDTLHVIAHFHPCAHPFKDPHHAQRRFHIYHLQKKSGDRRWTNLGGDRLTLPLTVEEADAGCCVFRSPLLKGDDMEQTVLGGFATGPAGAPHILFKTGTGKWASSDPKWLLAVGDVESGGWKINESPVGGCLSFEPDGAMRAWSTTVHDSYDGGRTWSQAADFRAVGLTGITLVRGGRDAARFIAYGSAPLTTQDGASKRKLYLWGSKGSVSPVGRRGN